MTFELPKDLEASLPSKVDNEAEWQNALWLVLPRWFPLRLHRCVTGKKKIERGGWMRGAPPGASDLNGWLRPYGRRVELEVKYDDEPVTDEQDRWLIAAAGDGCIALVARYEPADDLITNLRRVALALSLQAAGITS